MLTGRDVAKQLGRVGLWTMQFEFSPFPRVRETIGRLEQLGFPSPWYIEAFGREPLTQAALLLGRPSG